MPRYYFDMRAGAEFIRDVDGVDVVDAASAIRGCIAGIEDGMLEGVDRVEIRNEQGDQIAWIKVEAVRPPGIHDMGGAPPDRERDEG